MMKNPLLAGILGGYLAALPAARAQLEILNGDFEFGGGANIADVADWFDNNTGGFFEGAWQSNSQSFNGTNQVIFSSFEADEFGAPTPDVDDGCYLYQGIGTADGASELNIQFDWGSPTDDDVNRDLGVTVGVYAYDGIGAFVPGDDSDVRGAAGVTLLDSVTFTSAAGTRPAGGTMFVGTTANLNLTGAGGQELFLRFNGYLPTTTESWPTVDNVVILGDAPVFVTQPEDFFGTVGSPVTLTATAAANPAPGYQWEYSEFGGDPWTAIEGETSGTLVIDSATFLDTGYYRLVADNGVRATSFEAFVDIIYPDPTITAEPVGGAVQVGDSVTFTVEATGLGNLTYQWFSLDGGTLDDGGSISGATTASLTLSNVQLGDADAYFCEVIDEQAIEDGYAGEEGFIETQSAVLEVFEASATPLLSFEPFSAYPTGAELPGLDPAIEGYVDGWVDTGTGDAEPAVTAGSLVYAGAGYNPGIGGKVGKDADGETLDLTNSGRSERLLANDLQGTPLSNRTLYLSWLFRTGNENAAPLPNLYQTLALYNGDSTDDALRAFDAGIAVDEFGTPDYAFRVNDTTSAGFGVAADSGTHLLVARIDLSSTAAGDSVTMWLDPALGAGEPAGGTTIDGIDLVYDRLVISDYASDSSAWDEIRWGTSFDAVTIDGPEIPLLPEFTLQPTDVEGLVGAALQLAGVADGDPAPDYQWEYSPDGIAAFATLDGETSSDLVIDPAAYDDAGHYRVVASNINGSITSDVAVVTMSYPAPMITQNLESVVVYAGSTVEFTVEADTLGNTTYEWYLDDGNGQVLLAETTNTLTLTDVQADDEAAYFVVITDDAGLADTGSTTTSTSAYANLEVVDGIIIRSATTAPVTDVADQYYLPGNVEEADAIAGSGTASADNDGSTYVALDRASKGMTFTTGSNPDGYSVDSVTLQHVLWDTFVENGTFYNVPTGATLAFEFGTISASTKTPIYSTEEAVHAGAPVAGAADNGSGSYFTFDLSNAGIGNLAPNTSYYFEVAAAAGSGVYFELKSTAADGCAGGQAFSGDDVGAIDADNAVNLLAGDFAFHVDLEAIGGGNNTFANWIALYPGVGALDGFDDDPDGDGLDNGAENFLGTAPSQANGGLSNPAVSGGTFTFTHPQNPAPASDVSAAYTWSLDLDGWNADGASEAGTTVSFVPSLNTPVAGTTTVTATIGGTLPDAVQFRVEVDQAP